MRHFLGAARPLHRHLRRHLRRAIRLAAAGVNIGFNDAGAHRVHPNALCRHLFGQAQREGVNGGFARGVVHILAGRAQPSGYAGDIHNRPAAAFMLRAHAAHGFAGADEAAGEIGAPHALQPRHAHLIHPLRHIDHACVVDQSVQAPEFGVHRFKQAQHLLLIAHIGLHRDSHAACRANLPHHGICCERVGGVIHGHLPALLRGEQGGGRADAARSASDQQSLGHGGQLQQKNRFVGTVCDSNKQTRRSE